jgi:hypothetical protein
MRLLKSPYFASQSFRLIQVNPADKSDDRQKPVCSDDYPFRLILIGTILPGDVIITLLNRPGGM